MYILWSRKREQPDFEYISEFENKIQEYSEIDKLDRSIYQEAIIVHEQGCELYMEFEKPKILRRRLNDSKRCTRGV